MPPTQFSTRRGVRASAGSGKTYALTSSYTRAFLQGAEPGSMLATTFTRKAAGEILGRVLERVAQACVAQESADALTAELELPATSLDDLRGELQRLCRSLHQVSISTIDSFFSKLLRCFAPELGLPADVRTVDGEAPEMEELRMEAVRLLLTENAVEQILPLLDSLFSGQSKRSVATKLLEELAGAHELFLTTEEAHWQPPFAVTPPLSELAWLDALDTLCAAAEQPEFASFAKPMREDAARAAAANWEKFLTTGLVPKILGGDPVYYKKPIPETVLALYEPLIDHVRSVLTAKCVEKTQSLYRLLALYDTHYQQLCRQKNLLVFRDVPLLLSRLLSNHLEPEVAHRLDSRIQHLLLDEFQDTDPQQYAILKPFADRIHLELRGEGLIFCVGDLKQSIYGWRGATPEIFGRIEGDLPGMDWQNNDDSYRSSQVVLDAVNDLFGSLPANAEMRGKSPQVSVAWDADFRPHSAKRELTGLVEVSFTAQPSEETEPDDYAGSAVQAVDGHLGSVAQRILALRAQAPGASIGVLLRGNKPIPGVIAELRRLGVPASSEGGSPIASDPGVALTLSALRLADHPSDTVAAFHVLGSPLGALIGLEENMKAPFAGVALRIRQDLTELGYAGLMTRWAHHLAPHTDQTGARRLAQLIELADEHDQSPGTRPSHFVDFVTSRSVEEPSADLVRVMTIHKSKGLEFDIVVLPELHKGSRNTDALLYSRDTSGRIDAVTSRPSESLRGVEPHYARLYEDFQNRQLRESLCVLYVAMTRARRALHVFLPQQKRKSFSLGSVLKSGLEGQRDAVGNVDSGLIYRHGQTDWWRDLEAPTETKTIVLSKFPSAPLDLTHWTARGLGHTTPSSTIHSGFQSAEDLLGLADAPARRRRSALHALLSQIEWAGDNPTGRAIKSALDQVPSLSQEEREAAVAEFFAMVHRPNLLAALTRPTLAPGETVQLWREFAFNSLVGGQIFDGQFDRVVIISRDGQPVSARLLDFKSDRSPHPEQYRPQIEAYRGVLCNMLGLPRSAVECALLFTTLDLVVEME